MVIPTEVMLKIFSKQLGFECKSLRAADRFIRKQGVDPELAWAGIFANEFRTLGDLEAWGLYPCSSEANRLVKLDLAIFAHRPR